MRVVNRIEFTARDDAEAMRLAAERLGTRGVMAMDVADAAGLATDALEEQASFLEDLDL